MSSKIGSSTERRGILSVSLCYWPCQLYSLPSFLTTLIGKTNIEAMFKVAITWINTLQPQEKLKIFLVRCETVSVLVGTATLKIKFRLPWRVYNIKFYHGKKSLLCKEE